MYKNFYSGLRIFSEFIRICIQKQIEEVAIPLYYQKYTVISLSIVIVMVLRTFS